MPTALDSPASTIVPFLIAHFLIAAVAVSMAACEGREDAGAAGVAAEHEDTAAAPGGAAAEDGDAAAEDENAAAAGDGPDLEAERAALEEADLAFWKAADERGVEGFVSYLAADVVGFGPGGKVQG